MSGIICGNFGVNRGLGHTCHGVFHASCYRQHKNDNFPVLTASDLDDCMINDDAMEDEETDRFKVARTGDSMMCPFQCDSWLSFFEYQTQIA